MRMHSMVIHHPSAISFQDQDAEEQSGILGPRCLPWAPGQTPVALLVIAL